MGKIHILIHKLASHIFSIKALYVFLSYAVLLFVISMINRHLHIDDMWFGEQAYYLANDGVVKLKSMDGLLNFSERMFVYHKFHIILGAAVFKVFGWSVYPFKFFTLAVYLSFFFGLYIYYEQNKKKLSWPIFILAVALIFLNPNTFIYAFVFRPDILVMTLGFTTYFFIDRYLKTGDIKWIFLSGMFAGLAFFTHLNAIIFPIAGFIVLIIFKKFKALPPFFIVSALFGGFYFFDLWQKGHWEAMIYELKNYPILQIGKKQLTGVEDFLMVRISSLLNEPKRFLWSNHVYAFSVLFFISVLTNFEYLIKHHKSLIIFCALIILGMSLLVALKSPHYLVYYYPYMGLITAIAIFRAIDLKRTFQMAVFFIGFLVQFYHLHYEFVKIYRNNSNFAAKHREILKNVPDTSARILVPYYYIFNELPNYNLINLSGFAYYLMDFGEKFTLEEFYRRAVELNIEYVVYDKVYYNNERAWLPDNLLAKNIYFKKLLEEDDFLLLKVVR